MPAVDILKNARRGVLVIVDRRKRGNERTPAGGGGEGGATKFLSLVAPPRGLTPYLFIYHF